MDHLELLLADQIRQRATQFRNQARSTALDPAKLDDDDLEEASGKWDKEHPTSNEFIEMAYKELVGIAKVIRKLQNPEPAKD